MPFVCAWVAHLICQVGLDMLVVHFGGMGGRILACLPGNLDMPSAHFLPTSWVSGCLCLGNCFAGLGDCFHCWGVALLYRQVVEVPRTY